MDFPEHSRKEDVTAFLEKIRLGNPDGRIMIVLDNFKSHHALKVAERALELGIDLIFLPPYSPDLNPIEFIWKSIKRIISRSFIDSRESMCSLIEKVFFTLLLRIRLRSDSKSMEKHLYRGRVKGGGVFNLLPIPEVTIW